MRSIAESGIVLRSTIPPWNAVFARRRPFMRTSVRVPPRPRSDALWKPTAVAPIDPAKLTPPIDEFALSRSTASAAVCMPCCSSCAREITVTGSPVSPSMRLMFEPVISIRSPGVTACCWAAAGKIATVTARLNAFILLFMDFPLYEERHGRKSIAR